MILPDEYEKNVPQAIISPVAHKLIVDYFSKRRKPSEKKVATICDGVIILSESSLSDGKSVLHDATTTALPGFMEQSIFCGARLFLGDCTYFRELPISLLHLVWTPETLLGSILSPGVLQYPLHASKADSEIVIQSTRLTVQHQKVCRLV